jgi:hypothetical protein
VIVFVYRYKARIFYSVLRGAMQGYLNVLDLFPKVKDNIRLIKTLYTSGDIEIKQYEFHLSTKCHRINVITKDKRDNVDYNKLLDVIEYKNSIVYCGLEIGEYSLDLTSDFREFVYHFNKEDMLQYFFEYVKEIYKYEENHEDIEFVVFLNDSSLTQYNYKLKDVKNMMFVDILQLK